MTQLSHKLAIGGIVVMALAVGMIVGGMGRNDTATGGQSADLQRLGRYEIGGEFELTSQRGERMHLSDLAGNAVMLFFGYTYCPDICPATLARMRSVKAFLPPDKSSRFVGVLMSVDPRARHAGAARRVRGVLSIPDSSA